jgi:hypothetical protein
VGLLDLTVLNDQGVALAAVVAEDGGGIEVEIESLGEFAVGVGKEADLMNRFLAWVNEQEYERSTYAALLVSVEVVGPCLHARLEVSISVQTNSKILLALTQRRR